MLDISKKKYFRVIVLMIVLSSYGHVIANNLPFGLGSKNLWAVIWFVSILYYYPSLYINKFFLLYGVVFIGVLLSYLWIDMDDWNRGSLRIEFYYMAVAISVLLYFQKVKDYKGLAWITKWALIFTGLSAIMLLFTTTVIDPLAGRAMTGDSLNTEQRDYFKSLGIVGITFSTYVMALFPMMVYYYRNNANSIFSRKVIILFGLLCFIAVIKIQIFGNILVSLVAISIALLGSKRQGQALLLIPLFLIIVFLIPTYIYADLMISISSFFDNDSVVYRKLNDMAIFLTYGDRYLTGAGERSARYPLLLKGFIQNPFFGRFIGKQEEVEFIGSGGHLYWMNKLTILGLFGIIPILFVHSTYIKSAKKYFNKEFTFYFLISVFAILGLGLIKFLGGRDVWFTYFVLLPGLYFMPLLKKKRK